MPKQNRDCYVNPHTGFAFFDGITIKTDRITDLRYNKVFPILEEREIFMCRQMRPLLEKFKSRKNPLLNFFQRDKKPPLVLDIGTSSGVFAIYAAIYGCRVIAIDISKRALRVAIANAQKNDIDICDEPSKLKKESIWFIHTTFNESFLKNLQDKYKVDLSKQFDLVFVSARNFEKGFKTSLDFNSINYKYEGEEIKYRYFENQIKYIPDLLDNNGKCIGIQISPIVNNNIEVIEYLKTAFQQEYNINYIKIFDNDIDSKEFLKAQYKSFLSSSLNECHIGGDSCENINESLEDKRKPEYIEKYINDFVKEYKKLAFVYYECTVNKNDNKINRLKIKHHQKWQDQIWFHRKIVEYYPIYENGFPIPSLFIADFPSLLISGVNEINKFAIAKDFKQKEKNWKNSPLHKVDALLEWQKIQCEKDFLFDCIVIETLSIPDTLELDINESKNNRNLKDESKLWFWNNNKENIQKCSQKLFEEWHINIFGQNKTGMTTFLHPAFSGLGTVAQWGNVNYSTLSEYWDQNKFPQEIENLYMEKVRQCMKEYRHEFEERLLNYKDDGLIFDQDNLYSLVKKGFYQPYSIKKYYKKFNKLDIFKTFKRESYQELFDEWDNLIDKNKNIVQSLFNQGTNNNLKRLIISLLQEDLELCHRTMHRSIQNNFNKILNRFKLPELKSSMFFGIPLLVQKRNFQNSQITIGKLPENYRGAIWIYAATSKDWTIQHEYYLRKIARFTSLVYMEQYGLEAMNVQGQKGEIKGQESRSKILGHEVKHISNAMSRNWIRPVKELFEIEDKLNSQASTDKIGRIEIWNQDIKEEDLGITPFRNLVAAAGRLINFWSMLDNPADIPFAKDKSLNIEEFLKNCWEYALNNIIMQAFTNENPNIQERIIHLNNIKAVIKDIHNEPIFKIDDNFLICWNTNLEASDSTVWLARVFIALFTNCIKHSDPSENIEVTIEYQNQDECLYKVILTDVYIDKEKEEWNKTAEKCLLDKGYPKKKIEESLHYFDKVRDKLKYIDNETTLSTKVVVEECLEKIKGKLLNWSQNLQSKDKFVVEFNFKYDNLKERENND